jgi:hypothetical protein
MKNWQETEIIINDNKEPEDIEVSVEPELNPSRSQRYRIRVDSQYYIVEVPATLRAKQAGPQFTRPTEPAPLFIIPSKKAHNKIANHAKTFIQRIYSWLMNG